MEWRYVQCIYMYMCVHRQIYHVTMYIRYTHLHVHVHLHCVCMLHTMYATIKCGMWNEYGAVIVVHSVVCVSIVSWLIHVRSDVIHCSVC